MSLENQVAVITGGGRGIGLACARALAADGASVVIATPEDDEREAAVEEFSTANTPVLGLDTDVSDEEQVRHMAAATLERFGRIDILVNNAGIIGPTLPLHEIERADWDAVMAVNLTGVYLCARAVVPQMLSQGSGRIINISSVAGKIGFALRSPYAVSKWGVIGLTMTLAKELGSSGILVNAVCPGPIDGPRMDQIIASRAGHLDTTPGELREKMFGETALGRFIPPEHIADMVAFLASERAASITGQTLDVTAGHHL